MAGELILVVDDGATNRKLYDKLLSRVGYSVDVAVNAQDTLETLQTVRPDLILIDIHLGGTDGLELTRQIRTMPGLCSIPIIVMTAHTDEYSERQAYEAGADAFIVLPIDISTFVSIVRQTIKISHSGSFLEQKHLKTEVRKCL